jgi:hypothetical protein
MHYLKFNQAELPFKADFSVLQKLNSKYNIKPFEFLHRIQENDFMDFIEDALQYSLERGHKIEGKEFNGSTNDILTDNLDEVVQYFTYDVTWFVASPDKKKQLQDLYKKLKEEQLNLSKDAS